MQSRTKQSSRSALAGMTSACYSISVEKKGERHTEKLRVVPEDTCRERRLCGSLEAMKAGMWE